ncbi:MFS transporter [Novosphingobium sediminicola]|uniref:Oligogalacturonide transporter n=1 Tax=Novosphingobium sediminicola TaxID=563162 RepID=A0A7W6CFU4_9SPHN|nr:MFS transporter [Novosphingobium sediminicola]MBB3953929.1 oligogalacturonide transporter [Novosphingobium sediminicola]
MRASSHTRPVRLINFIAYGSNDVLGAGSMAILAGWVLFFYTRFCGLTPAQATIIFGVARVIDAFLSPIIGNLSDHFDRTRIGQRLGRRRVFILAAIPLLPSFALIWVPGQNFLYYLLTYVLFEMVYAVEIIPYETLASEMSPDYATRAKFAGARIIFGQSAAIMAGYMPLWLIGWLGRDSADTFLWMGCIFAVLFMLTAGFLYAFSWERQRPVPQEPATGGNPIRTLYRELFATLRVRAFRMHLGMYLGGYISQDIFNAAFIFFVVFALGGTVSLASMLMGSLYFSQLIAVIAAIQFTLRSTPALVYRYGAVLFAGGLALLLGAWWFGIGGGALFVWGAVALAGLGRGTLNYVPWAVYNYMPDVDEIMTGQRREGSFAGVMTFVRKATQAVAVGSVGLVMQYSGFDPKASIQTAHATQALVAIFACGTVTILLAGFVISLRFRLNQRTHAMLMAEIEHLRAGHDQPISPASKIVVEDLTGVAYHRLWGRA